MKFSSSSAWCASLLLAIVATLAGCGGGAPEGGAAATTKADPVPAFAGNGAWWNPAESGTGFFFEAQGGTGVVTFYMYEADGRAVWYTGPGAFAAVAGGKFQFEGALHRYSGGQPGKALAHKPPSGSTPAGTVSISFEGFKAQGTVAGRAFTAQKYFQSGASATIAQPETGAYWNPQQSGRGFTIEVNNNVAVVGAFHYAQDGQPVWHLVNIPLAPGGATSSGDMVAFSGGQLLTGGYKPPSGSAAEGKLSLTFSGACKGLLAFPGLPAIEIQRFAFGSLLPGGECRSVGGNNPPAERAASFAGTWVGCLVIDQTLSRRETWVLGTKQDGKDQLLYTVTRTQHNSGDCSGAATPLSLHQGTFAFASGTANIIEGIVMHGVVEVSDGVFKRMIGLQIDGQLRVGDQDTHPSEQGYATRLTSVVYRRG